MVLHDRGQSGLVTDGGDPAGQLRVPDGGVTTDKLVVVCGELDESVRIAEVESTL